MFCSWQQARSLWLTLVTTIGIALCLTASGLLSSAEPAFNSHPKNWSDYHQNWGIRCAPRADSQGRWGRQRQFDNWCRANVRYRNGQPDQQWRHDHPWDQGLPNDHVGGGG